MRTKLPLSKRTVAGSLAVVATVAASAVVFTVNALPSHAATCTGYVGLTFDDGPSNSHTPALLNALKQNGLRATMFNEGQYAAAYPAQVKAEVNAGMWIGNHSYTHPHLTQQSQSQIDSEISRTQQAIANAGGGTPKLFRPPYGETNSTVQSVEAKYGLTQIIWDVDSQDWNSASTDAIVQANARLTNGQVILMHEWPANTLAAIPRIAQGLAGRGLCAGMISPQTGRAVAPDGGAPATNPPTTAPPTTAPPTTVPPTTKPPTTPPSTTPPTGGQSGVCTATYQLISNWGTGFQGTVTVANAGSSTLNGWTVRLTLADGQGISSVWNGVNTGTTGAVVVKNAAYNGTIGPNAAQSFGFTANGNGSAAPGNVSCTSP